MGNVITYKIIKNNIDPFNKNDSIFNDICKNFTIEEIDIPIKERRQIIFLGYKEKDIICNDIDCLIEEYNLSNYIGYCKCKISNNFNYLMSNEYNNTNEISYEEYKIYIYSKSKINSFLIFRCGREAFISNYIKINPGFYISITLLIIQLILYVFQIHFNLRKKYNNIKLNPPPKIQRFDIDDDFEEEEETNKNRLSNVQKDSGKDVNFNKNIFRKKLEFNTFTSENRIEDNNIYNLNMETNNKDNINLNTKEIIFSGIQNEQQYINKNKRNIKNLPPIQKKSVISINRKLLPQSNDIKVINKQNVIKDINTSKTIIEFHWLYLSLIINFLELIKCLKIKNSYIPLNIKFMQFIFILSLNIFFNLFHLDQIYFRKKYNYFNDKYNIRYKFLDNKISLNERFSYGFNHSIFSGLVSFILCIIIESIFNYFFFYNIIIKMNQINDTKIKKDSVKRKSISNKNNKINKEYIERNFLMEKVNKYYLIYFFIVFMVMILIFYALITFNEVYRGGITDLISAVFWAFIFLEIMELFFCFILSVFKYTKNKK